MMPLEAPESLVLLALLAPFAGALLIPIFRHRPNLRETVTLLTAAILFLAVVRLLPAVLAGGRPAPAAFDVALGLQLAFEVEPLGMLFALVASSLWILNSIYSIGYMRANREPRQTGFYVCFAVALGSTIGIAFAKNLFTLFLFYEALTLSTYPLVAHRGDDEARHAGRVYLGLLLGTSMLLLLPAIMAVWVIAGTLDFTPGGILAGKAEAPLVTVLLVLFAFGIGKAALMPLHFWLPAAMVAPTPVSALLHAVAVVKAGVFAILKVVLYVFGLDTLSATGSSEWLVYAAAFSLLAASVIALTRNNLKARLAYSTVSQLAYVVLGAALATPIGIIGSGTHLAMHAVAKITLFFCAGAIYTAAHKTEVSELDGLGRRMPFTMIAFLVASLSIIGLPPLGGTWSKFFLGVAAADTGHLLVVGVLMLSSLLSVGYLLSIVGRAFFLPSRDSHEPHDTRHAGLASPIREAPLACVVPLCLTAVFCVVLFFGIEPLERLLAAAVSAE